MLNIDFTFRILSIFHMSASTLGQTSRLHWHHLAVVLRFRRLSNVPLDDVGVVFKMAKCNELCHLLYSNFHVLLHKINQLFTCKLIVIILTT